MNLTPSYKTNLTGLVICGGESLRMGTDKSLLNYHGVSQRIYLYNLLKCFCRDVFLSVNKNQIADISNERPYICDSTGYSNTGPLSALLTFWDKFPESSLLVAGCDYPFINKDCLIKLINNRSGDATCFMNQQTLIREPLITIYENTFRKIISVYFNKKNFSLSRMLDNENVSIVLADDDLVLRNINTYEEYLSAVEILNTEHS